MSKISVSISTISGAAAAICWAGRPRSLAARDSAGGGSPRRILIDAAHPASVGIPT